MNSFLSYIYAWIATLLISGAGLSIVHLIMSALKGWRRMWDYAEYAGAVGSLVGFLIFVVYIIIAEALLNTRGNKKKENDRRKQKNG